MESPGKESNRISRRTFFQNAGMGAASMGGAQLMTEAWLEALAK